MAVLTFSESTATDSVVVEGAAGLLTFVEDGEVTTVSLPSDGSGVLASAVKGEQGETGAQGTQGSQGAQGAIGSQGGPGAQGFQGSQGAVGSQGGPGSQGSPGAQGFQGTQGNQGATGPQGTTGSQGSQGAQGSQGLRGFQGFQGTQGAQGGKGDAAGLKYTYVGVYDYSGLTAGQLAQSDDDLGFYVNGVDADGNDWTGLLTSGRTLDALVRDAAGHNILGLGNTSPSDFGAGVYQLGTNNATSMSAFTVGQSVWISGTPQGVAGPQGAQGASGGGGGGSQGAQGAQGATGTNGTNGSQGFQGTQGAQGSQGSTGSAGGLLAVQAAAPASGSAFVYQGTIGYANGLVGAPGANSVFYLPLWVEAASTYDQLSVSVTTAGSTGAVIRLGIVNSDVYGIPATLVIDMGTIDATTIGVKATTGSQPVTLARGLYWMAVCSQGAPTTNPQCRYTLSSYSSVAQSATAILSGTTVNFVRASTSGAFPSTAGAMAPTTTANAGAPGAVARRSV